MIFNYKIKKRKKIYIYVNDETELNVKLECYGFIKIDIIEYAVNRKIKNTIISTHKIKKYKFTNSNLLFAWFGIKKVIQNLPHMLIPKKDTCIVIDIKNRIDEENNIRISI